METPLYQACERGDLEHVEDRIRLDSSYREQEDWNSCLRAACRGGHLLIVNLLFSKLAKQSWQAQSNDLFAFLTACTYQKLEIASFLIFKLREHGGTVRIVLWEQGFISACKHGHLDIAKFIISEIEQEPFGLDIWEKGFTLACMHGHLDIVQIILAKLLKARTPIDWNLGLENACTNGSVEIVRLLILTSRTRVIYFCRRVS